MYTGIKFQAADGTIKSVSEAHPLPTTSGGGSAPGASGLTDTQLRATPIATTVGGTVKVEPLGTPGVARQLTAGAASTSVVLTAAVRRISIKARNADQRFALGATATVTGHFIEAGERLDLAVPAGSTLAVIRDSTATADGILTITELT